MKTTIHPEYQETTITCACGNSIKTKSTVFPEIHTELCSACHPFYTGKQKFVDSAGRVDKFRARMEAAKTSHKPKSKESVPATETSSGNQEILDNIKKELLTSEVKEKSFSVDQTMSSKEELSAAEELQKQNKK